MTYEERVLKHWKRPFHKVQTFPKKCLHLAGTIHYAQGANDLCGDEIIFWNFGGRTGGQLWWEGTGCCLFLAAASMLTERLHDKHFVEKQRFSEADMLELFGVDVQPSRRNCVLTPLRTLNLLLEEMS